MFNDLSSVAIRSTLDNLALRQRVTADNIANINTPGFLAGRVMFEDSLATAVKAGRANVKASAHHSLEPTRLDGNNVNLDHETLANVDTGLRYSLMLRAMDSKFSLVSAAMRTQ